MHKITLGKKHSGEKGVRGEDSACLQESLYQMKAAVPWYHSPGWIFTRLREGICRPWNENGYR